MNTGKTLFAQIMDFLPWKTFQRIVARHGGDKGVRSLTCAEQFRAMAFAQLTYRESLRDIEACLLAQAAKLYHMGFREPVARSTLADANESRDWRIWEAFAGRLIIQARELYLSEDLGLNLKGSIPSFIHVSDGKLHDVHALDLLELEAGAIYVMDRGYVDFARLHALHLAGAFFVTRAKSNMKWHRVYSMPTDRTTGIICDQRIALDGFYTQQDYPAQLRRVRFNDPDTGKTLIFLTNQMTLPTMTICALYKNRWQVELFFKWIKQHLRIKRFFSTSEHAVKTQIWIAVSVYVLVAIIKKKLQLDASLYTLLQILSVTLFEKMPLQQAFPAIECILPEGTPRNQLNLFTI